MCCIPCIPYCKKVSSAPSLSMVDKKYLVAVVDIISSDTGRASQNTCKNSFPVRHEIKWIPTQQEIKKDLELQNMILCYWMKPF